MCPKLGRPKSDNPKSIDLNIRLTLSQSEELKQLAEMLNTSRTNVILLGIKKIKDELEK